MYIKNIGSILKENIPLKLKLSEGSVVGGKIISLQNNEGIIKLYDGTIIPAIFISENMLEKEKYIRFKVEGFDEDKILIKTLNFDEDDLKKDSLKGILKNLNIPLEKGKDIVMSLIKFNLPAKDENILSIYKNISFLNTLKDMSDADILAMLEKYLEKAITKDSNEFLTAKDLIAKLSNIDIDFLTFLTENEIPQDIGNILKIQNITKDGFFINRIITELNSILKSTEDSSNSFYALKQTLDILKSNPDKLQLITEQFSKNILENADMSFVDVLKGMSDGELLNFLEKHIGKVITTNDSEFLTFKDLVSNLSKLNSSFSTFTAQYNMPKDTTKNDVFFNKVFSTLKSALDLNLEKKESYILKQILDILKNNPEKVNLVTEQFSKKSFENPDMSFISTLKYISDKDILDFLRKNLGKDITVNDTEFLTFKDFIENLSKLNKNLSTFETQNNLMNNTAEILNNENLVEDDYLLNKILETLKPVIGLKDEGKELYNLKQAVDIFKNNPEKLQLPNQQFLRDTIDNFNLLKNIYNNYNIYAFNTLQNESFYKNNIIIKHKYKNSKFIDVNDVKVFITIETPHLGVVESYLYKKSNNIMVNIKVEDKYISLFKNKIDFLKNSLKAKGFNPLNISIEGIENKNDIIGLSSFFNEYILKELDVMV